MAKPKVSLPTISFCGIDFGHARWSSHVGRCPVCSSEWTIYKEQEIKRKMDLWKKKCECGCGNLAAYGKQYAVGHFKKTESYCQKRSLSMRNNNPMHQKEAKEKMASFWRGRERPSQKGDLNPAKRQNVREKISQNNSMKNKHYRKRQKDGCRTPEERERRSNHLKENNPSFDTEVLEKRVDTYTKRLAEGHYCIRSKWKTGWFEKSTGEREWFDSSYEEIQMGYYEEDETINSWTKRHGIRIPYVNSKGLNTYYVPDFLVIRPQEEALEEVKGWMSEETRLKAEVAIKYCRNNNLKYRLFVGKDLILVEELSLL